MKTGSDRRRRLFHRLHARPCRSPQFPAFLSAPAIPAAPGIDAFSSKTFSSGPLAGRHWRPRLYSTTNPGGVGHAWYRDKFVIPYQLGHETDTRYVRALATDNRFNNPEYLKTLQNLGGWQKRAWCDSDWDIQAGQYFTNFRRDLHVITDFNPRRASQWVAALDYGYNHYTATATNRKFSSPQSYQPAPHLQSPLSPSKAVLLKLRCTTAGIGGAVFARYAWRSGCSVAHWNRTVTRINAVKFHHADHCPC